MRMRPVFAVAFSAALLGAFACGPREPPTSAEVVAVSRASMPADPADAVWHEAPVHVAPLLLQDMVEPRLLQASTGAVRVQAVTDGARVAFRLEWADTTADDLPLPARFSDACAVQLPTRVQADVPAPQMGEAGRPVEIVLWRASWQAVVDGRGDTIQDLHPRASVDHYPFEAAPAGAPRQEMAARYSPARALGNTMAGPRERPVEDLVAEGPGTLKPAAGDSSGRGRRTREGWAVVLSRRLPAGLAPGTRSQAAFAVWEGAREEAGSRKMRTGWVPILVEKKP